MEEVSPRHTRHHHREPLAEMQVCVRPPHQPAQPTVRGASNGFSSCIVAQTVVQYIVSLRVSSPPPPLSGLSPCSFRRHCPQLADRDPAVRLLPRRGRRAPRGVLQSRVSEISSETSRRPRRPCFRRTSTGTS